MCVFYLSFWGLNKENPLGLSKKFLYIFLQAQKWWIQGTAFCGGLPVSSLNPVSEIIHTAVLQKLNLPTSQRQRPRYQMQKTAAGVPPRLFWWYCTISPARTILLLAEFGIVHSIVYHYSITMGSITMGFDKYKIVSWIKDLLTHVFLHKETLMYTDSTAKKRIIMQHCSRSYGMGF